MLMSKNEETVSTHDCIKYIIVKSGLKLNKTLIMTII